MKNIRAIFKKLSNTYLVTVDSDNGKVKIKTSASDEESAKKKIMQSEGCPSSAIVNIKKL